VLDTVQKTIDTALEDDAAKGVFRVARDIFTDPEVFELEMKHIFEGNWIYLAHESQIPNKNDYFTTYMGRQPIFIARNRNGELNAWTRSHPPVSGHLTGWAHLAEAANGGTCVTERTGFYAS